MLALISWSASAWLSRRLLHRARARRIRTLNDAPKQILILVLGCRPHLRSGYVNRYFSGRIASAAAAYHHTPGRRILCSGYIHDDGVDEAEAMGEALEIASVPRAGIDLDRSSARTIDSINCVATNYPDEAILLITQPFHMPRALYLARSQGLNAWGLIAAGPTPGRAMQIREAMAELRAVLDVWVSRESTFRSRS